MSEEDRDSAGTGADPPPRRPPDPGATTALPRACLPDALAVGEHAVAFVEQHAGIVLTPAGRWRLVEVVIGLVAQLEEWGADPVGGPPDPWTFLRRRWHRHQRYGWWGALPATTRRMLTGRETFGPDSLIQLALRGEALPRLALLARWRAALLDFDPAADPAAAKRLAARRASRIRRSAEAGHDRRIEA